MTNVPARVAADAREADQLLEQLAKGLEQANQAPNNDAPTSEGAPEPAPAPAPAAAPAVEPVTADSLARVQQELNSTRGRLAQQQAELEAARREAADHARRAEEFAAAARAAAAAPAPAPAPTPAAPTFDQTDVEDYGADTLAMMAKVAAQTFAPAMARIEQLAAQIANLDGKISRAATTAETASQFVQKTAEQKFYDHLDTHLKGWREANNEPAIFDWLEKTDPVSGIKYGELLGNAYRALDAERVAAIFVAYKPELAQGKPAGGGNSPKAQTAAVDVSAQVAPATRPGPAATPPPAGRVFKMAEYDAAHSKMLRGQMSKADFEKFESEYYAAVAEGRVDIAV